jgi:non-homologous end joining protein Ku
VLHYASQVRNVASWEVDLPEGAATDSERQLAEQLIALASGPVDWGRYRDTSAEELAALAEAMRARQPAPTAAEEPTVLRLLDALKQSVAAARQRPESSEAKARKPRVRGVTA